LPARKPTRSRRADRRRIWTIAIGLALFGVVAAMLLASRSPRFGEGVGTQAAPFTLPTTAGGSVSLSDFAGKDVLLYFSEGVGCDTCFYQMRDLERNASELSAKGLTVLPIFVNPADQVKAELDRFGLTTPFLVDADERVSAAYGVIGTGMHENLPGHSFILVDGAGKIAWRGDYPSMFVTTDQLLTDIGTDVAPR
jgi:peroxiredoxin